MKVITAHDRIPDCIAIRRAVFVEEQGVPLELEVDELDERGAACDHFLMLEQDDRGSLIPIGAFRAYWESDTCVHLQRFCILKEYRGRGFGREALDFIAEHYRKKGASRICFGAQCTAIPFYEKCGCHCVSDVFLDAGMPHRSMTLEL